MQGLLQIKYLFKKYPTIFRANTTLSQTQVISRQKAGKQHPFETKLITTLMRKGEKLKIAHKVNKWWIHQYRFFYRYNLNLYIDLTPEEILKKYLNKTQYIEFLKLHYKAWNLSDFLEFRLNTLLSIFQIKQYQVKNISTWYVVYLPPAKRINYIYSIFILHLRATRLLNKDFTKMFDLTIKNFIELNDTEQEIYDIKLQAYKQFLF